MRSLLLFRDTVFIEDRHLLILPQRPGFFARLFKAGEWNFLRRLLNGTARQRRAA